MNAKPMKNTKEEQWRNHKLWDLSRSYDERSSVGLQVYKLFQCSCKIGVMRGYI